MALEDKERKRKVLVVDPSPSVCDSIQMILKDQYAVLALGDLQEASEVAGREEVEIVLAGVDLPLFLYQPFFHSLRKAQPRLPLLLLLGERAAWGEKFDLPYSDWLAKPFAVQSLLEKVQALLFQKDWAERSSGLRVALPPEEKIKAWLYSSRVPSDVREKIFKVSSLSLPVFIQGEEGTGRSGVARAIHHLGPWKDKPFIHFFCRGLTPEEFTRKLSGFLKTAASGERVPLTLFLEEVDSLGWDLQTILLDFLDEQRIGWPGLEEMQIEAKIISSSSSSLAKPVSAGKFRGDLYQTLETVTIALKPLRERKEEIPRLASEILQERKQDFMFRKKFSPEALQVLQQYFWPGNLRELESLVLKSAALKEGELLLPQDLIFSFSTEGSAAVSPPFPPTQEKESLGDAALSTLAHEIKNPLVAINTFAHLLPEKYDDPEFREGFSRQVNKDVKRINELLENLLEYGQFSAPLFVPNDLNSALVDVLKQKEETLVQRGAKLTTDLKGGLPAVVFDENHLDFVLRNVLENVLSTLGENKSFRLSTGSVEEERKEGRKEFVELIVWYDGQDAIVRNLEKAVGVGPEPGFENLSLALALARKVVLWNRGEIQVNRWEGEGTTIRLRFPAAG